VKGAKNWAEFVWGGSQLFMGGAQIDVLFRVGGWGVGEVRRVGGARPALAVMGWMVGRNVTIGNIASDSRTTQQYCVQAQTTQ